MAALLLGVLKTGQRHRVYSEVLRKSIRAYATEADIEDYGFYPDPLEHSTFRERKLMINRVAGDDRYEPKVYHRSDVASRDEPNLVPSHFNEQVVGCLCEADSTTVNLMMIRKGEPKRCSCGFWFKAINCDPEFV